VLTAPRPPEAGAQAKSPNAGPATQSMRLAITAEPAALPEPAPVPAPEVILEVSAPEDAPADSTGALRVDQVLTPEEAVPAIPSSSVVGDLSEEGTISDAYQAVTPPPGGPSPGRVRDVGVTLFVADLRRSVAFYRDLLGFVQVDIGSNSAVLESGDGRIVLRRVVDMSPVDRRLVHLLLEVPDVQQAYEELRAKGIDFVHRPRAVSRYEQLELWSAAFRDPDGHGIALIRWDLRR
jgi:catechol 2,3-dioxygenase-like lactoylglutathione lyase family enzyme